MPIKESLQALMKANNWTAEQVTAAIKKLQDVSVENCNLKPYVLIGAKNQKIVLWAMDRHDGILQQLKRTSWFHADRNYHPENYGESIYRINPDFVIPDLEETAPRYESGTPVVVMSTGVVWTVGTHTKQNISGQRDGMYLRKIDDESISTWVSTTSNLQILPPRHDLQEGWEYTGKAAKIDGTQKLGEDEAWVTHIGTVNEFGRDADSDCCNKWRHIARKKKEEPVEYVDWPVFSSEEGYLETNYRLSDGGSPTIEGMAGLHDFMRFIWPDGTHPMDYRRENPDGGPALIPTHVRMAKEAE